MTLNFVIPEFNIGGAGTPPLQFFRRGFVLNASGGSQPSWKDIILSGNTALTLVNSKAGSLNYLKLFGGCEQTALPQGYTQLDSITLDGACYFDTGVVIDSLISKVTLIASFATQTDSQPCMMWGFMNSSTNNLPRWGVGLYSGKWLTSVNATMPYGTSDTSRHTFFTELYDNSGTPYWRSAVDGTDLGGGVIASASMIEDNTLSVYIGARNNNGTAGNFAKGDFTYLEIEQDGVLVGKIYPCKRDSDNTLGIYNTVTNEFITKSGSGTVTAGNTTLVPSPYMPLPIVCNNGVLTFGLNQTYTTADGQGTFVSPASSTTNRIYKTFGKLKAGKYKIKITGDFEFILQYKDTPDKSYTQYGNVGTWTTEGEYEITDTSMYYGVAIRNVSGSGNISPSDFNNVGSIGYKYLEVTPVGTVETVEITGVNLANMVSDNIVVNQIIYDTGTIGASANNYYYSPYIPIRPNTSYVLYGRAKSDSTLSAYNRICWYDKNQQFISRASYIANTIGKATSPANAYYARFSVSCFNSTSTVTLEQILSFNWTFAQATQEIPYEPYFNGGSLECPMLLSVGS